MLTERSFNQLVNRIAALGYTEAKAAEFAALIGDPPCEDDQGRIVVCDEWGRELARLALGSVAYRRR